MFLTSEFLTQHYSEFADAARPRPKAPVKRSSLTASGDQPHVEYVRFLLCNHILNFRRDVHW